jgi:hypothetical protein
MNLYLELLGYLGTALVVVSMTMSSLIRLRVINIVGSAIGAADSLASGVYPMAVMNLSLIVINLCHLIRDRRRGTTPPRKEI